VHYVFDAFRTDDEEKKLSYIFRLHFMECMERVLRYCSLVWHASINHSLMCIARSRLG
jgi:hypothetical protein